MSSRDVRPLRAAHDLPQLRAVGREPFPPIEGELDLDAADVADAADAADADGPASTTSSRSTTAPAVVPVDLESLRAALSGVDDTAEVAPTPAAPPDPEAVKLLADRAAPVALRAQYAAVVADCLDTMAMCARHRATRRASERASEEDRILALLDAIVVCPRFPHAIAAWWQEAVALPDPWKIWAPAFVIACTDGDDAAPALAGLAATLPDDDLEALGAAGEAIALGARPDLYRIAADLSRGESPAARALGIEALARMSALSMEDAIAALAPTSPLALRWAAARGAATMPEDRRLDELLLSELNRSEDPRVLWEVTRALALRGLPAGYHAMRFDAALLARFGPRALLVLTLFGDATDAKLAQRVVARCGVSTPVLRGLARYGNAGAAPVLLAALADEDASDAAADALELLFGELPDPDARHVPAKWRAHIAALGATEDVRIRHGKPYRPGAVLEAFREGALARDDLDLFLDEAAVRTGSPQRAETWRFSPVADPQILSAASALAKVTATSDTWWCATRTRVRGR